MTKQKDNSIGKKLRAYRKNCVLSQQQVADAIGVERSTYTCYENGRFEPSLTTISKLAQIFCVDAIEFLPKSDDSSQLFDPSDVTSTPIFTLTKDEKDLVTTYRVLNDKQKAEILAIITSYNTKNT